MHVCMCVCMCVRVCVCVSICMYVTLSECMLYCVTVIPRVRLLSALPNIYTCAQGKVSMFRKIYGDCGISFNVACRLT